MIEEKGVVLNAESGLAQVETIRTSSCQSCRARHGCGHHAIAQVSSANRMLMTALDPLSVKVGQRVVVGIPEDTLLRASIWMYLVPLLGLVLGATLPSLVSEQQIFAVLGSVSGFAGGFLFARFQSRRHQEDPNFYPQVLRVLEDDPHFIPVQNHP